MTDFLDEFYSLLLEDGVDLYKALAEAAIRLGYKPKREKTKHFSISFASSRYRSTVLKFVHDKHGPECRLKFFACREYSQVFDRTIKHELEANHFKFTGCYPGCQKCAGLQAPERMKPSICSKNRRSIMKRK